MAINLTLDVGNTFQHRSTKNKYKIVLVASGPVKFGGEWIHSRVISYCKVNDDRSLAREIFVRLENDFLESMIPVEVIQ